MTWHLPRPPALALVVHCPVVTDDLYDLHDDDDAPPWLVAVATDSRLCVGPDLAQPHDPVVWPALCPVEDLPVSAWWRTEVRLVVSDHVGQVWGDRWLAGQLDPAGVRCHVTPYGLHDLPRAHTGSVATLVGYLGDGTKVPDLWAHHLPQLRQPPG